MRKNFTVHMTKEKVIFILVFIILLSNFNFMSISKAQEKVPSPILEISVREGKTVIKVSPATGTSFKVGDKIYVTRGNIKDTYTINIDQIKQGYLEYSLNQLLITGRSVSAQHESKGKITSDYTTLEVPSCDKEKYILIQDTPIEVILDTSSEEINPKSTIITSEFPEETKYLFNSPIDTSTVGEKDVKVLVTFPDGTKNEIEVKIIVKEIEESHVPTEVKQDGNYIIGKGLSGAIIELLNFHGESFDPKILTTVKKQNEFSLSIPKETKDNSKLLIIQSEEGKKQSNSIEIIIDRSIPNPPKIEKIVEGDSIIRGTTDNDTSIMITFPEDFTIKGESIDGKFEINIPDEVDLEYEDTIYLVAISKSGNKSEITTELVHKKLFYTDLIKPLIPEKTIVNNTDSLTEHEKLEIIKAIKKLNIDIFPDKTIIIIKDGGTALIKYPDNSEDLIPKEKLIILREVEEPTIIIKDKLILVINELEKIKDSKKYINGSIEDKENLDTLLIEGKNILNNEKASQSEVDLVIKSIENIIKYFEDIKIKSSVDKSKLINTILDGKKLLEKNNASTALNHNLKSLLDYGNILLSDSEVSQERINSLIIEINKIIIEIENYKTNYKLNYIPNWLLFNATNATLNENKTLSGETKVITKYIKGYEDNTFRPEGNITRGEAAAMYSRLLTDDNIPKNDNNFQDVNSTDWYNSSISYVRDRGYTKGYDPKFFRPEDFITRAELVEMIFLSGEISTESKFSDINQHWAKSSINEAYKRGVILGYEDNTFRPDKKITRAEVVTILNRLYNRRTKLENLSSIKNVEDIKYYNDTKGHWAYFDILDASNTRLENISSKQWIEIR